MIRHLIAGTIGAAVIILVAAVFLWATPLQVQAAECGKASWYGEVHHGKRMANGKPFNMYRNTAASNTLPLGSVARVSYRGKSIQVTITDTGGFHKYGRIIDLSRAAFASLAPLDKGIITVCVTRVK